VLFLKGTWIKFFFRFSVAVSDVPAFVANNNQGAETEILSALDDLRDAVDRYDGVFQLQLRWIDSLVHY
jgi:hypothetical protein